MKRNVSQSFKSWLEREGFYGCPEVGQKWDSKKVWPTKECIVIARKIYDAWYEVDMRLAEQELIDLLFELEKNIEMWPSSV